MVFEIEAAAQAAAVLLNTQTPFNMSDVKISQILAHRPIEVKDEYVVFIICYKMLFVYLTN